MEWAIGLYLLYGLFWLGVLGLVIYFLIKHFGSRQQELQDEDFEKRDN